MESYYKQKKLPNLMLVWKESDGTLEQQMEHWNNRWNVGTTDGTLEQQMEHC